MKVLIVVPYYPHPGDSFSGIFNERCAHALAELCDNVEVLVPRPFAPPIVSLLVPRWKVYREMVQHEIRNGIPVYRPSYPQVPRFGGAFWIDPGAFFWCRRMARKMHGRVGFDVLLSFDLLGVGGLAWRLGRDLGIPACGWAIGGDVRFPPSSSYTRVVLRAIKNLDLVFYQSNELLERVASLLGLFPSQMSNRHVLLSRGIPAAPLIPRAELRKRIRAEWRVNEHQIVVLNIGRVTRDKGIFELVEAVKIAASKNPRVLCILVGSRPAFDDTIAVQRKIEETPGLASYIRLLPSCHPDHVWQYLCAGDIFAFSSHEEGMPNSLLEAMAMGLPSIAFAIPPVLEIESGKEDSLQCLH